MLPRQFASERALLFSSVLLTFMMLVGVSIVAYDAITIRDTEEIEEDTSQLLLSAEQWLNHQQKIEVAIRDYVLTGNAVSLEAIEENRRDGREHQQRMKEILEEYQQEAASARIDGLLAFTAKHQRAVDQVIAARKSGNAVAAQERLGNAGFDQFIDGAGLIIDQITQELQGKRTQANSTVSRNAIRGGISFGAMAVVIVAVIWGAYAITSRTQRRNRDLSAKLHEKATHDALTKLPNRDLFYDRLSQSISFARRNRKRLAVLYLDLDGFKSVNDVYGHNAGDATLKEASRRLRANVREVDTVARVGGDEFAIVLNDIRSAADAGQVAEKIIKSIAAPMSLHGGQTYEIGTSIGIAIYPDSGGEIDRLVNAADDAMYQSKSRGKNYFTYSAAHADESTFADSWINFADDFQVGIAVIDKQHQKIAAMLNQLNAGLALQEPMEKLLVQLEEFIAFTAIHFQTEERLMEQYGFPGTATHKAEHEQLAGEVRYLRTHFVEGGEMLVLQWLKDWLIGHVAGSDRILSEYLLRIGVR